MKKIAIVSKEIGVGGVEKALLSMLRDIDYSKFSVDLFLPTKVENGVLPEKVNIKTMETIFIMREAKYITMHPIQFLKSFSLLLKNKFSKSVSYIDELKCSKFFYKRNLQKYEIVISYDGPLGFSTFYSLYNLDANKKKIWIHGNVIQDHIPEDIIKNYYSKFDELIFVSKAIKEEFLLHYPEFKRKSKVYYNHFDVAKIKSLANNQNIKEDRVMLLTVARVSHEKGIDIALECGVNLKKHGLDYAWYICGTGVLLDKMKEKAKELDVNEQFVFLGEKDNPYPYMRACDIYVQPSRTEGFSTTTNEARILGKAIVTTDVGGMREQFVDRESALITPIDGESLSIAILEIVNNPTLKMLLEENNRNSIGKFNEMTLDEILE